MVSDVSEQVEIHCIQHGVSHIILCWLLCHVIWNTMDMTWRLCP